MAAKTALILAALILVSCVVAVRYLASERERAAEAAYPPEGQFVDVGGVRVHAVIAGHEGAPPIVLLHGAGGSTRDYTFDFVARLKDRYRVIVLDRPGLGYTERAGDYSVWSRDTETPREQARLLAEAAAALGAERPLVLGHSFGGAVAMAWALERPEDTAGLIIVAGATNRWEGGLGTFYNVTSSPLGAALFNPLATALAPDSYLDSTIDGIFAPQAPPEGYAAYVGPRISARRETLRANARQVHGLRPHIIEMSAQYPGLTMPIEIVHGDADIIVPLATHSIPLVEKAPTANLEVLPGIGHMPQHAAPEAVIAAIDRAAARAGLR
ncbi:MAG: alpha/beta hydrolase [Pseudomonadota bacterium]